MGLCAGKGAVDDEDRKPKEKKSKRNKDSNECEVLTTVPYNGKGNIADDDDGNKKPKDKKDKKSKKGGESYGWEKDLLKQKIEASGFASHAVIANFNDGKVRASIPDNFVPDKTCIKDILDTLKGNSLGLAERGIALGGGTAMCTPGKLDEGKAIYASDGKNGGACVFRSQECVLIVVYKHHTEAACILASEVSEFMAENGR